MSRSCSSDDSNGTVVRCPPLGALTHREQRELAPNDLMQDPIPNRTYSVRTFTPRPTDIERTWHVVDAEDLVLGRMATEVARILRGKHKAIFTPHLDTGDHVIIVNADKVMLTSDKVDKKLVWRHSGFPGGIKSRTYGEDLARRPEDAVRRTVRGMLPKNRLGRQMLTKLKVYAGPTHPHAAQNPQPLVIEGARRAS